MTRGLATRVGLGLAAAAVCALLPLRMSDYHAFQGGQVGFYFAAILGLAILTGYSGQFSLGHGGFMAVGAYTTAILVANHGVGELWTIPIAGLVTGAVGLVFGFPAVRLSGIYLSLVTFGFAVAVPSVAKKFDHFTGGSSGLLLPIHTGRYLYAAAWSSAAVLALVAVLLLHGRTGRAFRALRDSEVAAVSSGIDIARYKTLAFGLSAFYAGVAGSLLAIGAGYVNPDTFPPQLSLTILIGLAVGGFGPLPGLLIGAFFVELLPIYAQTFSKQAPQLVYGIVLLVAMLLQTLGVPARVRLLAKRMLARP